MIVILGKVHSDAFPALMAGCGFGGGLAFFHNLSLLYKRAKNE